MKAKDVMSGEVVERVVSTLTTDQLALAGAYMRPPGKPKGETVVWIHGGLSNFYEPQYLAIGKAMARLGYGFLTCNTRGHDAYALLRRGADPVPGGSCFENFDESHFDVSAWIGFAIAEGASQVVLAGHSQGAAKVVDYVVTTGDARVRALIAASPPAGAASPPNRVKAAELMVAEGRGGELMPPAEGAPPWNIISAQTVVTRDAILRRTFDLSVEDPPIAHLSCPILVLEASEDEFPAGWADRLAEAVPSKVVTFDSDHFFSGTEDRVATAIGDWLT